MNLTAPEHVSHSRTDTPLRTASPPRAQLLTAVSDKAEEWAAMLKQILEAMYVDAELLELMSEDQQQLLFRQIREEQLRRWQLREKEEERKKKKSQPKRTPRKVREDGGSW